MSYTPHYFKPHEWRCKCGKCADAGPLAEELLIRLDVLRVFVGGPVIITSGWRCPAHNAKTPGAVESSRHLLGRAADLQAGDIAALAKAAKELNKLPSFRFRYIEVQPRYVHVDV